MINLNIFVCVWDQRLVVPSLTAINLLVYVADMVYLILEGLLYGLSSAQGLWILFTQCGFFTNFSDVP